MLVSFCLPLRPHLSPAPLVCLTPSALLPCQEVMLDLGSALPAMATLALYFNLSCGDSIVIVASAGCVRGLGGWVALIL